MPVYLSVKNKKFRVELWLESKHDLPRLFGIKSSNCILSLTINEKPVQKIRDLVCSFPTKTTIDFGPYLKPGLNSLKFELGQSAGNASLDLSVSRSDPGLVWIQFLFYTLVTLMAVQGWRCLVDEKYSAIVWLYLFGIVTRIVYVTATPPGVREHDYLDHQAYIEYMANHLIAPAPGECITCFHPPLYYFLNSVWYRYFHETGSLPRVIWNEMQLGSFILSVLTLGVGLWLGTRLFPASPQRWRLVVFAAVLCVFPGSVFLSSRLNNDTLLVLISFTLMATVVRWWQSGSKIALFGSSILIGVGLLTKKNIVVLFPATFLSVLSRRRKPLNLKLMFFLVTIVTIYTTQTFLFPRAVGQAELADDMRAWKVENSPSHLLVFNPAQVIEHPYNRPNSDGYRREYFAEYLFRSAFLGEFNFGRNLITLCRTMLSLGMLAALVAIRGLIKEVRTGNWIASMPIWTTLLSALLALLHFRVRFSLSCAQDFRYISILVIPIAYYIAEGTSGRSIHLNLFSNLISLVLR